MRKPWRFAMIIAVVQLATIVVAQRATTELGVISGVHEGGLNVYKGVPFAAPPVGDLRWRPPAHVATWTGTRKAEAFAPACMQSGVSMPGEHDGTVLTRSGPSVRCSYLGSSRTISGARTRSKDGLHDTLNSRA